MPASTTYTETYKELVTKNSMNAAPSILMALDKLDANRDAGKRKALFDAATAAITKWDNEWTAENKTVTDQKDKLARSMFAVEVRKMKQAIQADATRPAAPAEPAGAPAPATPAGRTPPPAPAAPATPWKKTTLGADYSKARAEVPFGGVAAALWSLDRATTSADAKPLAQAAQAAVEKELAELDAAVKSARDNDLKLKVSQYGVTLRKLLGTVKELAK